MQRESLHEALQRQLPIALGDLGGADDRPERIHDDEARAGRLHFRHDPLQDLPESPFQHIVRNREEAKARVDLGRIEERELLLVAEQLQRGFTQDRDVEGRTLRGGQGKADLVH